MLCLQILSLSWPIESVLSKMVITSLSNDQFHIVPLTHKQTNGIIIFFLHFL